jgi:hypothetical protein
MRPLIPLALLPFLVTAASARPATYTMSCGQTAGLVATQGAVVMSTGQYTYERFVSVPGSCLLGEHPERAYAPTQDERQCWVGYVCKPGRSRFMEFDD